MIVRKLLHIVFAAPARPTLRISADPRRCCGGWGEDSPAAAPLISCFSIFHEAPVYPHPREGKSNKNEKKIVEREARRKGVQARSRISRRPPSAGVAKSSDAAQRPSREAIYIYIIVIIIINAEIKAFHRINIRRKKDEKREKKKKMKGEKKRAAYHFCEVGTNINPPMHTCVFMHS